ncbi:MAG: caspase family protein [Myxococcaceae bacterium]|nr:caspase family protein [Myxococcaceae bacterium]
MSALVLAAALLLGTGGGEVHRLALVVGVNDGGAERPALRYAATDAQSLARVLVELGGLAAADAVVLLDSDVPGLLRGLEALKARARSATDRGERVEVLVYYSGHSDEEGLLLHGQRLGYAELRSALEAVPSTIRVAILDSCASGAFTRAKGGSFRPAFLDDESTQVRGQAILTSASDTEAAQESDVLRGSFFTHHLVSGLRGAADLSRDGRVTLNEAYQYAYRETLARTARTRGGAQHPGYDIALVGAGDLVMTDLHASSSLLLVPVAFPGRFFVRDGRQALVAELNRRDGEGAELGLPAGGYTVLRDDGGHRSQASVSLASGARVTLSAADAVAVGVEDSRARGGPPDPRWRAGLLLGTEAGIGVPVLPSARLSLAIGQRFAITAAAVFSVASGPHVGGIGFTEFHGGLRGGVLVQWLGDRWWGGAGLEVGPTFVRQTDSLAALTVTSAVRATGGLRLGERLSLALSAGLGLSPYRIDGVFKPLVNAEAALGLEWSW